MILLPFSPFFTFLRFLRKIQQMRYLVVDFLAMFFFIPTSYPVLTQVFVKSYTHLTNKAVCYRIILLK